MNVTGHRGADRIIRQAEARGLNVEVDRSRGTFHVVRIDNEGLPGNENGLNRATVTLYVSFASSQRGRLCGGYYSPLLGKQIKFDRHSPRATLDHAALWVRMLYIAGERAAATS